MINLFFDRLIDLLKMRQENKEKLFTEFVESAYESFEKTHQNIWNAFGNMKNFYTPPPRCGSIPPHRAAVPMSCAETRSTL